MKLLLQYHWTHGIVRSAIRMVFFVIANVGYIWYRVYAGV